MSKNRLAINPPAYESQDVAALQAMARGEATPEQQKRGMDWIINNAARTYDVSYRPGDSHETSFAEGRRFVGLMIIEKLKISASSLRRRNRDEPTEQP